jgi:hypothetical protein
MRTRGVRFGSFDQRNGMASRASQSSTFRDVPTDRDSKIELTGSNEHDRITRSRPAIQETD